MVSNNRRKKQIKVTSDTNARIPADKGHRHNLTPRGLLGQERIDRNPGWHPVTLFPMHRSQSGENTGPAQGNFSGARTGHLVHAVPSHCKSVDFSKKMERGTGPYTGGQGFQLSLATTVYIDSTSSLHLNLLHGASASGAGSTDTNVPTFLPSLEAKHLQLGNQHK